jgi:hypothetical protein
VKKNAPIPKDLPELFGPESLQEFLFELNQVNASLLYRDPTTAGWILVRTLSGEGEAAPELFHIYEKDGRRAVFSSDMVNQSVRENAAATSKNQYDEKTERGRQASQSRNWSSLISLVHFFDESSSKSFDHRHLHALLIAKGVSEIIGGDLKRLRSLPLAPAQQASITKRAAEAYESGLKNFLTAIGARRKKGTPRKTIKGFPLPWEWLAMFRAQQFVAVNGTLPNQGWLIQQLKQDGIAYQEDNGRGHSKWRELLARVSLDLLPK